MFKTFIELLAPLVARRLVMTRPLFPRLSIISLVIFGTILTTPFWEVLIDRYYQRSDEPKFASPWLWGGAAVPLSLCLIFAWLAYRFPLKTGNEPLVHTPVIGTPVRVGSASVRSYCGSVEMISGIDAVVTSENHDLRLASIAGTSVSARMRRMAATKDDQGNIIEDHLSEFLSEWRATRPGQLVFPLGTCIPAPPFNAANRGVKRIILAVTLEIRNTGENFIDEHKIRDICEFVLNYCREHGYKSVFFPTIGIGGGRLPAEKRDATLNPLLDLLEKYEWPLSVYIGTYRASDAVAVQARLSRYPQAL